MTRRRLFGLSLAPLFAPLLAWLPGRRVERKAVEPVPQWVGFVGETVPAIPPDDYTIFLRGVSVSADEEGERFARVLIGSEWLKTPLGAGCPIEPDGDTYAINGEAMLKWAFLNHIPPFMPPSFKGIGQLGETGWLVERPSA